MAELPPPGRLIADPDGTRVQCHLCGAFYAKLGMHVRRGHGMEPDDYRDQFGLNRETALVSPVLFEKLSALNQEHLARVRPAVNPVTSAPSERKTAWRRVEKRLQTRQTLGEAQRAYQAEHPQPKKHRLPRITPAEVRERGRRRIAEVLQDPVWRAAWGEKQVRGMRERAHGE